MIYLMGVKVFKKLFGTLGKQEDDIENKEERDF